MRHCTERYLYIRAMDAARKERLRSLPHIIAALVILLQASSVYEERPTSATILLALGSVVFLLAVFHKRIELAWPYVPALFLFIEAALGAVILMAHVNAGKKYLPYAYALVVLIYVVAGLLRIRKIRKLRKSAV